MSVREFSFVVTCSDGGCNQLVHAAFDSEDDATLEAAAMNRYELANMGEGECSIVYEYSVVCVPLNQHNSLGVAYMTPEEEKKSLRNNKK